MTLDSVRLLCLNTIAAISVTEDKLGETITDGRRFSAENLLASFLDTLDCIACSCDFDYSISLLV